MCFSSLSLPVTVGCSGWLAGRGDGFVNAVYKYNADGFGKELSRSISTGMLPSKHL